MGCTRRCPWGRRSSHPTGILECLQTVRDLLEILDDRYDRRSTLITSQLPIDQWHAYLGDRTVADAILDRVVHNSYRLILKGESMRRHKTVGNKSSIPSKSKNI